MPSAFPADLNSLTIFVHVMEAGGITAAADRLGVAKNKVSVALRRLEATLGLTLFVRTTRKVVPTEAGRRFYERCKPALAELEQALTEIGGTHGALSGTLKIGASVDHAVQVLAPAVAEFARLHPDLNIALSASDRVGDMVAEGIDVSFRVGWLRDSSMRALKLGGFEEWVVASPAYLRAHGTPRHPRELAQHAWIALSLLAAPRTWHFSGPNGETEVVRLGGRLQTDSPAVLQALLGCGAGLSVLPAHIAADALNNGRLQRVLPDWSLPRGGIYAVYPPGQHLPPAVRAFVAYLRTRLDAA